MALADPDLEAKAKAGDAGAQVQLAARLDEAGRHHDAINWLARAAKAGRADALAALGLRLLTGQDAPFLPKQGAGLLSDAAMRGSAQAAAQVSVLAGGGFHGPQSLKVALDYLRRAAELGWRDAQDQLRILAQNRPLAEQAGGEDVAAGVWRSLRQSVDTDAWTSAPAPILLSKSPRVLAVEALASPEVCDFVVEQSRGRLVRAEVFDAATGKTIMGETRTNRTANFTLTQTCLLNLLVQAKIAAAAGVAVEMMEAFAVLNYQVGEQASEHFDYLDPSVPAYASAIKAYGQRVATCLLYLNDDYEGGETDFPELGLSHRGRKGDALIFFSADAAGVPDPRTVHAGRPPTAGEKWVLSQFIRNRPRAGLG
jgi:hypothetical protein